MQHQERDKHRQEEHESIPRVILSNLFSLLKIFLVCFILVYFTANYVVRPFHVNGASMYPTLKDGEFGFSNAFSGHFQEIHRGDIVVVFEGKVTHNYWVKRVIGLPGDTIKAKNDRVYINGRILDEPYLDNDFAENIRLTDSSLFMKDFSEVTLGEDEYFLMGDNRYISMDSREMGPFKRKDIKAVGFAVAIPFGKMRVVN